MTQKEKDLLINDLCARLPYKPIVQIEGCGIWDLRGVDHDDSAKLRDRVIVWHGKNYPSSVNSFPIIECKPFLYPLSSMTEEQLLGLSSISFENSIDSSIKTLNWCYKNHFDVNNLIPMGLAIDCTNLNVY